MATADSSLLLLQSKAISDTTCKYCLKKVINKVKCIKCEHVFHPACLKQASELKKADCKHETDYTTNKFITEENFLKEENKLLRQIIQDKDTIINDKNSLIELLEYKISSLGNRDDSYKQNKNPEIKNKSTNFEQKVNKDARKKQISSDQSKKQGDTSISKQLAADQQASRTKNDPKNVREQIATNLMEIQTKQKCEEIINLANASEVEENHKGFTKVKSKKTRPMEGSGNGDSELHGRANGDKKIWLFITRIPDKIEVKNIENYIKNRTNSDNIIIKKLPTKNSRRDNQSFMIGVEPCFKEQIYDSSFWPKGIVYNRFNFKLGQHFLDNPWKDQPQIETANSGRPKSFL